MMDDGSKHSGTGKTFASQRAAAQAGRLVTGANKEDGACGYSAKPMALHSDKRVARVRSTVAREDVSHVEATSQSKYGSHREKIRTVLPVQPHTGWGKPGR